MSLSFFFARHLSQNSMSSKGKQILLCRKSLNVIKSMKGFIKLSKIGIPFHEGNHIVFFSFTTYYLPPNLLGSDLNSCTNFSFFLSISYIYFLLIRALYLFILLDFNSLLETTQIPL